MDADARAIRSRFRTLEELAGERGENSQPWRTAVLARQLPSPSYVLDGEEFFPPTLLSLVDEAGGVEALRAHFEERFVLAADATGAVAGPDELDEAWDEYLSGAWGRILFDPTPESAVQANRLAGAVAELLADPQPTDPFWVRRLRARVDALAAVLWEGCAGDRANDEAHPWDVWVVAPRRDYADVLASPPPDGAP